MMLTVVFGEGDGVGRIIFISLPFALRKPLVQHPDFSAYVLFFLNQSVEAACVAKAQSD